MAHLQVLRTLDTEGARFYHFKAVIPTGMGLFSDSYDLFCITPVMILIGRVYYVDEKGLSPGAIPLDMMSAVVGTSLLGTVVGQLVFGYIGDRAGRRKVYSVTLLLMVFCSFASGFSPCRTRSCVLPTLCFFRFWLSVGIGGDYPLSSLLMSEMSNKETRGSFIAAVFSMQGFGILVSSFVTMTVTTVFDKGPSRPLDYRPPKETDWAWRLILMIGGVPALLTFYWRMMMPETPRYTALVEGNIPQAVRDAQELLGISLDHIQLETAPLPAPYSLFSKEFRRHHGRALFGCATSWMLIDIVFYCTTLFQSNFHQSKIGDNGSHTACREAYLVARLQAIMAACSTIPGYWASVFLVDRIGRVKIQMMGFLAMSICLFAIGMLYNWFTGHTNAWFFILYGLTFFFSNCGPNTTTFIVPAELFPAQFRSTCHGVAGAFGKVGAIIGSIGFIWASQSNKWEGQSNKRNSEGHLNGFGMKYFLIILGGICVLGCLLTYFFTPETNGRSLEDNENKEEPDGRQMLRRSPTNGCVVSDEHSKSDSLDTETAFHSCPTSL